MTACAVPHPEEWPQEATDGLLCRAHGQKARDYLGAREGLCEAGRERHGLTWMWERLELAYPSLSVAIVPAGGVEGPKDPEAERLAAVLALRADIRDWLGSVAADLQERLGMAGPSRVRLSTDYRVRHIGTDWDIVSRSATWLLAQADLLLAGQGLPVEVAAEAIVALLAQADDLASRAHAMAPWRPVPTALEGIPCRCMVIGAVHDHGDVHKCWACGREYDDDQWSMLMKVMAHRFSRGERDADIA